MSISRASIDQIVEAAELTAVVGEYVHLKKKGTNWEACCPFHDEKTASFKVNPVKGIYKCFGCGKGGDVISFIMDIESLSYLEALRFLAKKFNIELEESKENLDENRVLQSEKEAMQIVVSFAQEYFKKNLTENEEGVQIGLTYFKERGIRQDIIAQFGLGYALDQWDGLLQAASKAKYSLEIMEKVGLLVRSEDGSKLYDRFRGRVTFPIHNISGKVVGFGARILSNDKKQAKYINSPESLLYDKSHELYGLYFAKQAIRQADLCYLTEGYMDVLAMHQAGIINAVASSGTSLTEGQIKQLKRFTENLTLLFDGDKAGIKAALRGVNLILAAGLNVRIVVLPDGHDPDSFAKQNGSEALQQYLVDHSEDFIRFKARLASEEAAQDPVKKAEALESIVETIALVPNVLKRTVFAQEASSVFQVDESILLGALNQKVFSAARKIKPGDKESETEKSDSVGKEEHKRKSLVEELERELLRLLLLHGSKEIEPEYFVADYVFEQMSEIDTLEGMHQSIYKEYFDQYREGRKELTDWFFHHPEESIKRTVIDMCTPVYSKIMKATERAFEDFLEIDGQNLSKSLFFIIAHLKKQIVVEQMIQIENQLESEISIEEELVLLQDLQKLKSIEMALARELGGLVSIR